LRRENSALVGFLVLAVPRRLPGQVELALAEAADELALALADRPQSRAIASQTAPQTVHAAN